MKRVLGNKPLIDIEDFKVGNKAYPGKRYNERGQLIYHAGHTVSAGPVGMRRGPGETSQSFRKRRKNEGLDNPPRSTEEDA